MSTVTVPTESAAVAAPLSSEAEAFVARLARTAYEIALRHGPRAAFTDLELSLWQGLREVVRTQDEPAACMRSQPDSGVYRVLRRRSAACA
jgi:hypothetical protein